MRAITILTAASATLIACADTTDTLPTLEIVSPSRGLGTPGGVVTVKGGVTDDGAVTVSVNGTNVVPADDGTFQATITVGAGIGIIETIATDAKGNTARDVRAVFSGEVAATDGSLPAPAAAHAGPAAIREVGTAMGDAAEQLDFTSLVKAFNPVYNNDGCLGARVDVTSVDVGAIDVSLVPRDGFLDTDVAINNVVVRAHASYKFSCIGGSTDITVRVTKARIGGNLGVGFGSGKIDTSLPDVGVALDGFDIDVGGVPGAVEDLLNSKVRDAVASSLEKVIEQRVPAIADQALAGLLAKSHTVSILGHDTDIGVVPTDVVVNDSGIYVAIESVLVVQGGEGGMFVSTPRGITPSVMDGTRGLGVALADDAINQLFGGLWAAQALHITMPIEKTGPLAAILDDDATTVTVAPMLPPQVSTDGGALHLAVGDLLVTTRDANGQEIQTIAVSVKTPLTVGPSQSGKLLLGLGTPEVKAQVIAQNGNIERPLTDEQVEGIVGSVWGVLGNVAGDALAKLPMPEVGGLAFGAPSITAKDTFLVADVAVD